MKDLPADAAPAREAAAPAAPAALADAELLALLLRTGCRATACCSWRSSCWTRFGGFAGLLHAEADAT